MLLLQGCTLIVTKRIIQYYFILDNVRKLNLQLRAILSSNIFYKIISYVKTENYFFPISLSMFIKMSLNKAKNLELQKKKEKERKGEY